MKILVIEDNQKLAESLKRGLEGEGFAVDLLHDGVTGERRIMMNRDDYDLVVLDIMLPGKDGIAVCKEWRKSGVTIPVLMLTAREMSEDKVEGLDSGSDDYLAKPFAFDELVSRIRALLRRGNVYRPNVVVLGNITLDSKAHTVHMEETLLDLTLKEFMVLEYLMHHPGVVITRDELYDHAWDYADSSFSNTVDVHIKNLRKKIHDDGKIIQTVRGVGYKMEA